MNEIVTFTSPSGDEMVVIPAAEYRQLRDAAEMAEDVAAYDEVKEDSPPVRRSASLPIP